LADPSRVGSLRFEEKSLPFAFFVAETLHSMGGPYALLAEILGEQIDLNSDGSPYLFDVDVDVPPTPDEVEETHDFSIAFIPEVTRKSDAIVPSSHSTEDTTHENTHLIPRLIKRFADGSVLEFDKGNFDNWCVFLTRPGHARFAPKDWQYLTRLQELAAIYSSEKVYSDFVSIFDATTQSLDPRLISIITIISNDYTQYVLRADIVFSLLYAEMIAEENKNFAPLGKRIKRLSVYQVVMENLSPREAATFSIGRPWQELAHLCTSRGF